MKYASVELMNDKEIVNIAVLNNGFVLEYASEILKCDIEIVKIAIKQNCLALQYTDSTLSQKKSYLLLFQIMVMIYNI